MNKTFKEATWPPDAVFKENCHKYTLKYSSNYNHKKKNKTHAKTIEEQEAVQTHTKCKKKEGQTQGK